MHSKINENIWMVLRPNYLTSGELNQIGILGTGFFVNKNKFITAHHCVNEEVFTPNDKYLNTNILILSTAGDLITINKEDTIYKPEIDITIISTKSDYSYLEKKRNLSLNTNVLNFGYPTDSISDLIYTNPLRIKETRICEGKISYVDKKYSVSGDDVKLNNKEVIILNYTAPVGFSGGPLLSNGKVIGMMSHINPKTKTAVAISSKYFYNI